VRSPLLIFSVFCVCTAGAQTISTIAGNGISGYNGDGIAATSAELYYPQGLNFDGTGNLLFVDQDNHRLRKVDMVTGLISTIAGTGTAGYNGDGILATAAQLNYPVQVTMDALDNIYIVDWQNNRIRKINQATGIITTVAGTGVAGYNGDGILATAAQLNAPAEVEFDPAGNMYIGDWSNQRVRKVEPGIYLVKVEGDKKVFSKKFIIE
jgi:sugar lactone lactonase YvrE